MSKTANFFDPWGPISTMLYEINDSDIVQNAIANTGIDVAWKPLLKAEEYSHATRIRAMRRDINAAYVKLDPEERGQFAQIVAGSMIRGFRGDEIHRKLASRLSDIGWTISSDGFLKTEDTLVSEQFFPPNSEYDAYMTIRNLLGEAHYEITIVDAYLGSSLLLTLKSLEPRDLKVKLLTVRKNIRPDFCIEMKAFNKQVNHIHLEIRNATDFHDRFIVIDGQKFYHVGASIKDAGQKAFMISPIHDEPNIYNAKLAIDKAWSAAQHFQP